MRTSFLLLIWMATTSLFAQNSVNFEEQQNLIENMERSAFIEQAGAANSFTLDASGNQVVAVLQMGTNNIFNASISGSQNQSVVAQQGNENEYQLSLNGQGNNINVEQVGNENRVVQSLQGVNNLDIEISQFGDGHEIIHEENGLLNTPISISQSGSPMSITVTTNGN